MKVVLFIALFSLFILVQSANFDQLAKVRNVIAGAFQTETDGVLQCISDRDIKQTINNASLFCG